MVATGIGRCSAGMVGVGRSAEYGCAIGALGVSKGKLRVQD